MKTIDMLLLLFERISKWVVIILMGGMSILAFSAVIFRFLLHNPLTWSEEAARYMMIWVTFAGAGMAMQKGKHIGVTLVINKLPSGMKRYGIIVSEIFLIAFLLALTYQGINLLLTLKTQLSPAIRMPMVIPYFAIPFGCTYMFLHVIKILFSRDTEEISTASAELKEIEEGQEQ